MNSKLQNQTSPVASEARLLRGACHRAGQRPDPLARNDVDVSVDAVIARSAQRDEAISVTQMGLDAPSAGAHAMPRFGGTNPRNRFGRTNPRPSTADQCFGGTNPRYRTVSMADGRPGETTIDTGSQCGSSMSNLSKRCPGSMRSRLGTR